METKNLYYHKTDGGAEYLTDKYILCPNGHKEGIFDGANYIIRIDGDIRQDVKLIAAPETVAERDRLRKVNADFLAALERCVDVIGHNDCSDGKTPNGFVVALEHARAAIAKAEGKE